MSKSHRVINVHISPKREKTINIASAVSLPQEFRKYARFTKSKHLSLPGNCTLKDKYKLSDSWSKR